jgi:hypothetical protein
VSQQEVVVGRARSSAAPGPGHVRTKATGIVGD